MKYAILINARKDVAQSKKPVHLHHQTAIICLHGAMSAQGILTVLKATDARVLAKDQHQVQHLDLKSQPLLRSFAQI